MNFRRALAASLLAAAMTAGAVTPVFAEEAEVRKGGTLVVAFPQSVGTMDTTKYTILHEGNCARQVLEPLFVRDNKLNEFVPVLATEWSVSEDGQTYYFTLRDDVYFSNGRKMTAEDVRYSFERTKSPSATQDFARGYYDYTEVLDDTHVAVHLTSACAPFMSYVASLVGTVVPQEEVEAAGDKWGVSVLVGTGPFLFKEFVTDEYVLFEKNPNYWGEEPNLDGIKVVFISDPVQIYNAVRTGDVHLGFDMSGDALPQAEAAGVLVQEPASAINWVKFNMESGPTADPRVRKALLMAVDTEEMNEGIYQYGEAENIFLPVPPTQFVYDDTLAEYKVEYDPDGAKQLLKEAGYGKGLELNFYFPVSSNRNKMGQILQSYYEEVGVKLNIIASATPEFSATACGSRKNPSVNLTAAAWNGSPDPHFFLNRFYNSVFVDNISNTGGYADSEVDEWLHTGFVSTDTEVRREAYRNVLAKTLQQYTGYYYSCELRNFGVNQKVHDFAPRGDDALLVCTPLNNIWLEQ